MPHANAAAWAVQPLAVSKTKRFLDSGLAARFWAAVDHDVYTRKPHLVPKGTGSGPAGAGAQGAAAAAGGT